MWNFCNFILRILILTVGFVVICEIKPVKIEPIFKNEICSEPEVLEFDLGSDQPFLEHFGGTQLDHEIILQITNEVLDRLELVSKQQEFKHLVFETMIVETLMGKSNYSRAAKRNNFGIAQIRPETAKDVLKWIKRKNLNDYYYIISLKNSEQNLNNNLLTNVHFSVAICAEFYAMKNVKRIDSKFARAKIWKKFYNTEKGTGTVNAYLKRVENYYAEL